MRFISELKRRNVFRVGAVHASDFAALMASMGRYDEGLVYAERVWKLRGSGNHAGLAWAQIYLGNFDAARRAAPQASLETRSALVESGV